MVTLTSAHSPAARSPTRSASAPLLPRREQHAVVVRRAVVGAVVEVGVEAVLVRAGVEDPQPHLLGRAERGRDVGPARGGRGSGARERRLPGEAGRVVELEPERGGERGVVRRGDVVRGHAPAGEEVAEVERRAVDGADAPTGPLDLDDAPPGPLGGLGQRLGLEDAGVEGRRPVGEGLTVDVERVVGRARGARPGAGGQRVPAGAGVGRRLRQQPTAGGHRAPPEQFPEAGDDVGVGRVGLDPVLHEAVGGEQQQPRLLRRRPAGTAPAATRAVLPQVPQQRRPAPARPTIASPAATTADRRTFGPKNLRMRPSPVPAPPRRSP